MLLKKDNTIDFLVISGLILINIFVRSVQVLKTAWEFYKSRFGISPGPKIERSQLRFTS